ncbi:MAG: hypothetical protein ACR2NP_10630, partial [Pirellulaceae bacterium]
AQAAWQERYDAQREILVFAPELPRHIRDELAKYEPMERPIEEELQPTLRDTYSDNIPKRMPVLAAKVNTTWSYDVDGQKAAPPSEDTRSGLNARVADVPDDVVVWEDSNQELWNNKTTEFGGHDGNTDAQDRPTTQQMLALQQDLWILEGMLDVIAVVNDGYTANDLAPIDRIDHILVGKEAVAELGEIAPLDWTAPSAGTAAASQQKSGGLKGRKRKRKSSRPAAKSTARGAVFTPSPTDPPFHGRYVNRDFSLLSEQEIVRAVTSTELTEQSYLAVAKRVPVRVAVRMDERKVNEFLAAAANSPFAFEIRQVRINRHEPGEGVNRKKTANKQSGGKERGNIQLGGGPGQMADAPGKGSRGGGGGGDGAGGFVPERRRNFDIEIEFIGIVKIYNPVVPGLFLPGGADQDLAQGGTGEPDAGQ